jgi:hypothetical protein
MKAMAVDGAPDPAGVMIIYNPVIVHFRVDPAERGNGVLYL